MPGQKTALLPHGHVHGPGGQDKEKGFSDLADVFSLREMLLSFIKRQGLKLKVSLSAIATDALIL